MPIARCFFDPKLDLPARPQQVLREWSQRSGVDEGLLTIDFTQVSQRVGQSYLILASLWLPTAWSVPNIEKIQLGLAQTLSAQCQISAADVIVMTQRIHSGLVVEEGELLSWKES